LFLETGLVVVVGNADNAVVAVYTAVDGVVVV
jgi:hypothetical protein